MPRMYTVPFENVATTVQSQFFELTPASNKPIELVALYVTQTSEVGDAQEEMIRAAIWRGSTSTGAGGTAVTPVPLDSIDTAAGFTAQTMSTALGSTASATRVHAEAFNVRNGWFYIPPPEMLISCTTAGYRLTIRMEAAPADSISFTATAYIRERS